MPPIEDTPFILLSLHNGFLHASACADKYHIRMDAAWWRFAGFVNYFTL
jgi:hypothetical protein